MTPRKKTSPKSPSRPVRPGKYDPTRKPKGPGGTDSRRPMGARRRTVATPPSELPGERLQKVLASAGIASRREAEQIILEGRVEVDGVVVTELGTRVDRFQQAIFIDGLRLPSPKRVYYAVNKPVGVVCTARDPAGRPRIADLLPPDTGRVFNVGRLDMSSDGLILVTNDGDLANRLTHPRHGVRKTYHVQVAGLPDQQVIFQLSRGMHLAEGFARPVEVRVKTRKKNNTILEMVLDEGRNREIRRMLAKVGHKVQSLTRIAVGPIRLGELPRGAVRKLTPEEVRKLQAAASDSASAKDKPPRDTVAGPMSEHIAKVRKRRATMGKAQGGKAQGKSLGRAKPAAGTKKSSGPPKKHTAPRKRGTR